MSGFRVVCADGRDHLASPVVCTERGRAEWIAGLYDQRHAAGRYNEGGDLGLCGGTPHRVIEAQ